MKSNAERQQDYRERMRAQGYQGVLVYVRPEHRERLKRYLKRLDREVEK